MLVFLVSIAGKARENIPARAKCVTDRSLIKNTHHLGQRPGVWNIRKGSSRHIQGRMALFLLGQVLRHDSNSFVVISTVIRTLGLGYDWVLCERPKRWMVTQDADDRVVAFLSPSDR